MIFIDKHVTCRSSVLVFNVLVFNVLVFNVLVFDVVRLTLLSMMVVECSSHFVSEWVQKGVL